MAITRPIPPTSRESVQVYPRLTVPALPRLSPLRAAYLVLGGLLANVGLFPWFCPVGERLVALPVWMAGSLALLTAWTWRQAGAVRAKVFLDADNG